MGKTPPLRPVLPKLSLIDEGKLAFMAIAKPVLWGAMILSGFQILVSWAVTVFLRWPVDSTAVQYSILVAVGSYFCLIMDNEKIREAMNIKNVPYLENRYKPKDAK